MVKVLLYIYLIFLSPLIIYADQGLINKAIEKNLFSKLKWHSLLHYNNNHFYIKDSKFLLVHEDPSIKNEMIKTLELYFADNQTYCRFPARLTWLSKELDFVIPKIECPTFEEFKFKAPAKKIQLVFASQNLLSSSSLMGHTFLKLSDVDQTNPRQHAVTFFAKVESYNPFSLFFESVILGMEGKVALLPYRQHIKNYQEIEGRNVWEFDLNISNENIELLHNHIWELKDISPTYFFHKYNCSTFTYFLLSIANENLLYESNTWISPRDVVKNAFKYKMIENSLLLSSDLWLLKNLYYNLDSDQIGAIKLSSSTKTTGPINKLEKKKLESFKFLYALNNIKGSKENDRFNKLISKETKINDYYLKQNRDPFDTPDDSQFSISLNKDFTALSILPMSHRLRDNNKNFISESELKLLDTSILYNFKKQKISLDYLTIYSVTSLLPFDSFTYGISWKINTGIHNHYYSNLSKYKMLDIELSPGFYYRLLDDVDLALFVGPGTGVGVNDSQFYMNFETNLVIREVFDLKTILSYSRRKYLKREKLEISEFSMNQTLFTNNITALFFNYQNTQNLDLKGKSNSFTLIYTRYF